MTTTSSTRSSAGTLLGELAGGEADPGTQLVDVGAARAARRARRRCRGTGAAGRTARLSRVVLPAPLGPRTTQRSSSSTCQVRPRSRWLPPRMTLDPVEGDDGVVVGRGRHGESLEHASIQPRSVPAPAPGIRPRWSSRTPRRVPRRGPYAARRAAPARSATSADHDLRRDQRDRGDLVLHPLGQRACRRPGRPRRPAPPAAGRAPRRCGDAEREPPGQLVEHRAARRRRRRRRRGSRRRASAPRKPCSRADRRTASAPASWPGTAPLAPRGTRRGGPRRRAPAGSRSRRRRRCCRGAAGRRGRWRGRRRRPTQISTKSSTPVGGAGVRLGDGGQVDVVLEDDRGVQVLAQRGEQAAVPAGQVEREGDVAGARVDQAGGAEHDPAYAEPCRVPALARRLHHRVVHDADRVVGVLGGLLDPADDRAGDVGAGGDDAVGGRRRRRRRGRCPGVTA